ncbi:MAG: hypothetical protein ACD_19C00425G0011 [uncultured bacterium]|nr:MAG: hypothetical protein ACD_19C00425G0011 [uncultured bacterium]
MKTNTGLLDLNGVNIVFTSPFQFLNLAVSSSLSLGLIITIPLLIYQFLTFLKPALKVKEYRSVMSLLPVSIILFIGGFVFAALMPPTDILSMTLLALPLVVLFELTLLLNRIIRKGVI